MQHEASFWTDLDRLLSELIVPENRQQKSRFWRIRKAVDNEMKLLSKEWNEKTHGNLP